jgi:hypothetical protein
MALVGISGVEVSQTFSIGIHIIRQGEDITVKVV